MKSKWVCPDDYLSSVTPQTGEVGAESEWREICHEFMQLNRHLYDKNSHPSFSLGQVVEFYIMCFQRWLAGQEK